MKKSKFSESRKRAIVLEGEKDTKNIEKLCEQHQISVATYYKWKQSQSVEAGEDKKRLCALEKENVKLKKMYLESQLDKEVLLEAVAMLKKMQAQPKQMP